MTWRSREKLKNSIGFKLILARKSQKQIKPCEKGRSYRKLAVLAKEHIKLGILLGQVPKNIILLNEFIYEKLILDPTPVVERQRKTRNKEQRSNRVNRCRRTIELFIMCGEKPWKIAH